MKKYYNERGMGTFIKAMMMDREFDQDLEMYEAEVRDDFSDYDVDDEEVDEAEVEADFRRSESEHIRKYGKVIVEEEFKKRRKPCFLDFKALIATF